MSATIDGALEVALAKATRDPDDVRREIAAAVEARGVDEAQLLARIGEPGRASVIAAYIRELLHEPDDAKRSMLTAAAAAVVTLATRSAAEHSIARRTIADLQPSDAKELVRIRNTKGHGHKWGEDYADGVARAQEWRASDSRDALDRCVTIDTNIAQGFAHPLSVSARGLLVLEVLAAWLSTTSEKK